jgi:osmotically-inducible protein OsmY
MDKRFAMCAGMGLGAGLMFLLDPSLGRRRRSAIGDKARSLATDAEDKIGKTGRNLRNHARGWMAETRHHLKDEPVDDYTLVERVRAALGRATSQPGGIDVLAEDGQVTLIGAVPAEELDGVLDTVETVRGVKGLDCRLECRDTTAEEPAPPSV